MTDLETDHDPRTERLPDVFRGLADHMNELVLLIDFDGTQVASLGPSPGLMGHERDALAGEHVAERVHPDDLPRVLELLQRGRDTPGLEEELVVRARHRDGSWRQLHVTGFSHVDNPLLRGGVVRLHDVTDVPVHLDASLERSRFVSLAEALPVGVLSADAHGFVVFANSAAQKMLSVGFDRLRGERWLDQVHERDELVVAQRVAAASRLRQPVRLTFATRHSDGHRWLQLVLVPQVDDGRYVGWVATVDDVTERLVAERQLAYRATHDALTGLPNRWLLADRVEQSLARIDRGGRGVAVVFVDLDGFKAYNDDYGHAGGDAVLADVAVRLRETLSATDTAARVGGDEFVALSEVADGHEAAELAACVESALSYEFAYQGRTMSVSASVGVTFSRDPHATPETLLGSADAAMYASRQSRRS